MCFTKRSQILVSLVFYKMNLIFFEKEKDRIKIFPIKVSSHRKGKLICRQKEFFSPSAFLALT